MSSGDPACPCLASWGDYPHRHSSDGIIVTLGSVDYTYDFTYGLGSCGAWDELKPPYCNEGETPEWCFDEWCFVDGDSCTGVPIADSSYFPGLKYSYQTCGASNTFDDWFDETAASDGSHTITDVADVIQTYLQSVSNTLEGNYAEVSGGSISCSVPDACSCSSCQDDSLWQQSIDVQGATLWQPPDSTMSADKQRLEECLASFVSDSLTRAAAKESGATRVGYAYYASQDAGSYVQWPGTDWCPSDFDPRFRDWYAAAASGPKDVVLVLDTSGSMMVGGAEQMARDAAKAVLDTLTDADYVAVIGFSTSAFSYSSQLEQATAARRASMKSWIDSYIGASGSTDYVKAFQKTWALLEESPGSSNCNRVVLFMTDGVPNYWLDTDYDQTRATASSFGARIFTYGLGSASRAELAGLEPADASLPNRTKPSSPRSTARGLDMSILKQLACENNGIAYTVTDSAALANTMASFYKVLSPTLEPCKVRWVEYNDAITNTKLLAACLASFKPESFTTSCQGGLTGLGEASDPRVPSLLGVACIDLNMLVSLDVIEALAVG